MHRHVYRYSFDPSISSIAVESALKLAFLATEFLHGESAVLVEARYTTDLDRGLLVIDGSTPVGLSFNRLFTGFARLEFGADSFIVEIPDALGEYAERHAA